jgi:1,4-dihydroxy-2-naphthoate octaprenyltransferase
MKKWILAARPKTLTAAFVPILVGTALARVLGYAPKWDLSLFAALSAFAIQIGTNLFNDAIDFAKGTDNETRIGPQRVTQSGLLSHRTVMLGGALSFLLAALFAIPLLIAGGKVILVIGILSLICGYAYTGGPFPLAYLGLGELFVILFFGLAAVGGVFYLQTGILWDLRPLVAGIQIGFLSTVLLAINNLRDREGDSKTHKKTLAVRFGKTFARREIACLAIVPSLLGLFWILHGALWAGFLPLLTIPLGVHISMNVARTEPSAAYNRFLGQSALLHLLFGVLFSLGCYLSWYAPGGGS